MKEQLWQKYEALKARGLAPDREAKILSEIEGFEDAGRPRTAGPAGVSQPVRLP